MFENMKRDNQCQLGHSLNAVNVKYIKISWYSSESLF